MASLWDGGLHPCLSRSFLFFLAQLVQQDLLVPQWPHLLFSSLMQLAGSPPTAAAAVVVSSVELGGLHPCLSRSLLFFLAQLVQQDLLVPQWPHLLLSSLMQLAGSPPRTGACTMEMASLWDGGLHPCLSRSFLFFLAQLVQQDLLVLQWPHLLFSSLMQL